MSIEVSIDAIGEAQSQSSKKSEDNEKFSEEEDPKKDLIEEAQKSDVNHQENVKEVESVVIKPTDKKATQEVNEKIIEKPVEVEKITEKPTEKPVEKIIEKIEKTDIVRQIEKPAETKAEIKKSTTINSSSKKGGGLSGIVGQLNYKGAVTLNASDANSISNQITAVWSISIFKQEEIKNLHIIVEVTVINAEIKSVNIIDSESNSSHQHYGLVKDSIINALKKCQKLRLTNRHAKGEHRLRFKFNC